METSHMRHTWHSRIARRLAGGIGAAALALAAVGCGGQGDKSAGDSMAPGGGGVANASNASDGDTGDDIAQVQKIAMRSFNGSAQQASAGRAAFMKYNCVGCHGGLAGGAMGPSLRDDQWKFGGTDEQILNTLHNGRPAGMPAWKGVASEEELKNIIVYIRSMRSPQEPTWFFSPTDTTTKTAFLDASNVQPVQQAPAKQ
jgi:mono/diheme cytochrome c family protein